MPQYKLDEEPKEETSPTGIDIVSPSKDTLTKSPSSEAIIKSALTPQNIQRKSAPARPGTSDSTGSSKMKRGARGTSSLIVDTKQLTHDEIREMMAREGTPEGTASECSSYMLVDISIYAYLCMYTKL